MKTLCSAFQLQGKWNPGAGKGQAHWDIAGGSCDGGSLSRAPGQVGLSRSQIPPGGMDPQPCLTSHQVPKPTGKPHTQCQPQRPLASQAAPSPFLKALSFPDTTPSMGPPGTWVSQVYSPSQVLGSKGTSTGPVAGRRQAQRYLL